ncbi:MAG: hypothetical protein LBQ79_05375 [Deltaproteobacteria bacterium]|nr:hypothetical protein [Deltaproteobacteria bacterium]
MVTSAHAGLKAPSAIEGGGDGTGGEDGYTPADFSTGGAGVVTECPREQKPASAALTRAGQP